MANDKRKKATHKKGAAKGKKGAAKGAASTRSHALIIVEISQ